ncbi:Acyl-coenzyme A oxidase (Acyl-CoA oxidase) [Balamuthia mandrillaris]
MSSELAKKSSEQGKALLERERQKASFPVRELTYLYHGGKEKTEFKERIQEAAANDPILSKRDKYFLSRPEYYKRVLQKVVRSLIILLQSGWGEEEARIFFEAVGEELPIGLHGVMFIPTLYGQGTDEQREKWLSLAKTFSIIGCYAQTELGHGSNVRGLETTATYDKETQEFVLHSPTITAAKWWPGGLGLTSTHCVTHARLLLNGKDYGVHTFVVQIRSLEDHSPLPGITVGDIGPKFGYDTQDNGFLLFNHVRIPRENMLMRYQQVSPEGVYTAPPKSLSKIGYATMIRIRAGIVATASTTLAKACTIAIRYGAVRCQFSDVEGQPEKAVLDYPMQQYRLLPLLATAFAFHFTGRYMANLYERLLEDIKSQDASALPEVHATSAGLKAYTTWITSSGIEECRKCCGGHGYSKFAALSDLFVNYVPACTYEGDNVVMSLQTARFLLKSLQKAMKGEELYGSVTYLSNRQLEGNCPARKPQDLLSLDLYLHAYGVRARSLVTEVGKRMHALKQRHPTMTQPQLINLLQIDLVKMVKAHCFYTMVLHFVNALKDMESGKIVVNPSIRAILAKLCSLFALYYMEQDIGTFLESGYLTPEQAKWVSPLVQELLQEIRPQAVPLVDAFGFSDYALNSSLGRKDGDVYEHLFHWAKENPLNAHHQPPGYQEYLKPLLTGKVWQEAFANKNKQAAKL